MAVPVYLSGSCFGHVLFGIRILELNSSWVKSANWFTRNSVSPLKIKNIFIKTSFCPFVRDLVSTLTCLFEHMLIHKSYFLNLFNKHPASYCESRCILNNLQEKQTWLSKINMIPRNRTDPKRPATYNNK